MLVRKRKKQGLYMSLKKSVDAEHTIMKWRQNLGTTYTCMGPCACTIRGKHALEKSHEIFIGVLKDKKKTQTRHILQTGYDIQCMPTTMNMLWVCLCCASEQEFVMAYRVPPCKAYRSRCSGQVEMDLSMMFLTKPSHGVAKIMLTMCRMIAEISGNITERRLNDAKASGGFACAKSCIILSNMSVRHGLRFGVITSAKFSWKESNQSACRHMRGSQRESKKIRDPPPCNKENSSKVDVSSLLSDEKNACSHSCQLYLKVPPECHVPTHLVSEFLEKAKQILAKPRGQTDWEWPRFFNSVDAPGSWISGDFQGLRPGKGINKLEPSARLSTKASSSFSSWKIQLS